jgi:hypothetical protein
MGNFLSTGGLLADACVPFYHEVIWGCVDEGAFLIRAADQAAAAAMAAAGGGAGLRA